MERARMIRDVEALVDNMDDPKHGNSGFVDGGDKDKPGHGDSG
jgi:hypothetical protein